MRHFCYNLKNVVNKFIIGHRTAVVQLCCEDFISHWASWIPAERVSSSGPALCCLKKEISEYRKWVGRNYPFKLLPLWDFRDVIMASDKLFGTEPNKIKDSFPSLCMPINLLLFCPSSSRDLCWFVRFGTAEWCTSDYNSCYLKDNAREP